MKSPSAAAALLGVVLLAGIISCSSGNSTAGPLDVADGAEVTQEVSADAGPSCPVWDGGAAMPVLHVEERSVRDEYGRAVLLRGVNAGNQAKKPPHIPWEGAAYGQAGFQEDLARYYDFPADWGMNCIRLTVFWEAIEPVRGEYDQEYVEQTRAQIQAAVSRGMYVFIDFHQDIYSRILGGSGAPAWALPDPDMEPVPLDDDAWFFKVFQGEDVLEALDWFWENENGVQDSYKAMALWFSLQFKDEPGVIGIDIMNEPTPGSKGKKDADFWLNQRLKPMYEEIGNALHEARPGYVLFIESTSLEAAGVPLGQGLPRPDLENMVYSPHYYNTVQFISGKYDGKVEELVKGLTQCEEKGAQMKSPVLLSEYGFRGYSEEGNPDEYLTDHYDVMDDLFMHGTIWSHEVTHTYWNNEDCAIVNGDWNERASMADNVARPYPAFTSGDWLSFSYDAESKKVEYSYLARDTLGAPTEIVLPRRHYPTQPQVILGSGRWEYDEARSRLLVFDELCATEAPEGKTQTVVATPGPTNP